MSGDDTVRGMAAGWDRAHYTIAVELGIQTQITDGEGLTRQHTAEEIRSAIVEKLARAEGRVGFLKAELARVEEQCGAAIDQRDAARAGATCQRCERPVEPRAFCPDCTAQAEAARPTNRPTDPPEGSLPWALGQPDGAVLADRKGEHWIVTLRGGYRWLHAADESRVLHIVHETGLTGWSLAEPEAPEAEAARPTDPPADPPAEGSLQWALGQPVGTLVAWRGVLAYISPGHNLMWERGGEHEYVRALGRYLTGWSLADPEKPVLKPCPFCGSEPRLSTGGIGGRASVFCCSCDLTLRAGSEAGAIEAWNKRGGGGGHE